MVEKIDIPLCMPYFDEEEQNLVKEVLDSGWLAHGPKTEEFEKEFAKYTGVKKAVSLNSCTSALQLAILANNLKGEIILPSFTFVASANSIVNSGCRPVFSEVDYNSCNILPEGIRKKITKNTVAIMPVHYAGQPCNMKEIMEIAEENNLIVIEDSAECIGGTFNNKKTGSFGIGCFSFYPTKNMTTGEGGMVTTNDLNIADKIKALRAHGIISSAFDREKKKRPWLRIASFEGYNYRLCDILSAIGIVQLRKLDKMNNLRRKNAEFLNKSLNFNEIKTPEESKGCKNVYQMYTVKVENIDRTKFISHLREKGIGASVHFDPPVHLQDCYLKMGYKKGSFPITEKLSESIVTLPMYPQLTKEQLVFMVASIEEAIKKCRNLR